MILVCAYTIWLYVQVSIPCTIPSGSPFPSSPARSLALYFKILNTFHKIKNQKNRKHTHTYIGIMVSVFTDGLGDWSSIPVRVISKTQKMVLDTTLLDIQLYKVQIKGKQGNPGKRVVRSPTYQCSSYWKGNLQVALNYCQPTYIYIYIYMRVCVCVCVCIWMWTIETTY